MGLKLGCFPTCQGSGMALEAWLGGSWGTPETLGMLWDHSFLILQDGAGLGLQGLWDLWGLPMESQSCHPQPRTPVQPWPFPCPFRGRETDSCLLNPQLRPHNWHCLASSPVRRQQDQGPERVRRDGNWPVARVPGEADLEQLGGFRQAGGWTCPLAL